MKQKASAVKPILVILAIVGLLGGLMSYSKKERERNNRESERMDRLVREGYRLQPNGTMQPATREELWKAGSVYDYRYDAVDSSGKSAEVYARNGEKRIYGKVKGYDKDLNYGDITVTGEWVDKGRIRAMDAEGRQYDLHISK